MVSLSGLDSRTIDERESTTAPTLPSTNATRHLSAGAYIDDQFCLDALRRVYFQPRRIVAPSHGFDAIVVLGHCLRARRAMLVRDALLVGVVVCASWLSVLSVFVVLATLLAFHVAVTTLVVGRESITYLRQSSQFAFGQRSAIASRGFRRLWLENVVAALIARVFGVVITYVAFAGVALAAAIWLWHSDPVGDDAPLFGLGCLVGSAFLVPIVIRVWSRLQVHALVPGREVGPPVSTSRLDKIEEQNGGNTVVYSGLRPFVGSGEVLRRWDIAQRLVKRESPRARAAGRRTDAEREFPTPPFQAQEISNYVRDHIDGIAHEVVPERRLPSLTVVDRVFVAGTEVSDLRPYTSPARVAEIIRDPTAPQRHYLVCQVVSWRGELVTTVYVHFAVQGKALYVELYVTGLFPCDDRFRVVDQVNGTGVAAVLRDAARAVVAAPVLLASAPVNLMRAVVDQLGLMPAMRIRKLRQGYDYGAAIGLREIGASETVRDHMQTQDIIKYGRVIERRVLAAILDFLETKEVDIQEYRQRSLTILNAGAVATNGATLNVQGDVTAYQDNSQEGGGS